MRKNFLKIGLKIFIIHGFVYRKNYNFYKNANEISKR